MRNALSRVEKLEQADWAKAPIEFIFTGRSLARGEKPGPGVISFMLTDPMFEREADTPGGERED